MVAVLALGIPLTAVADDAAGFYGVIVVWVALAYILVNRQSLGACGRMQPPPLTPSPILGEGNRPLELAPFSQYWGFAEKSSQRSPLSQHWERGGGEGRVRANRPTGLRRGVPLARGPVAVEQTRYWPASTPGARQRSRPTRQ